MPRSAQVFDVLIASPSDTGNERDTVEEAISRWNADNSRATGIALQPRRWETHTHPDLGERPQAIVNQQIVDGTDIVVAVFSTKLGTATGEAISGTVEEIERCHKAGAKVMVYFSDAAVERDVAMSEHFQRLEMYRKKLRQQALYETYRGLSELREKVGSGLTQVMHELVPKQSPTLIPVQTTSNPDTQRTAVARGVRSRLVSLEAKWETERDTQYPKADNGKQLVSHVRDILAQLIASQAIQSNPLLIDRIKQLMGNAKDVEGRVFFADGGVTWFAFWQDGSKLFHNARALLDDIEHGENSGEPSTTNG